MNRLLTETAKIARGKTGLNGALFAHVDYEPDGTIRAVRFSYKWKDEGTLDKILMALGETVTAIIGDVRRARR